MRRGKADVVCHAKESRFGINGGNKSFPGWRLCEKMPLGGN